MPFLKQKGDSGMSTGAETDRGTEAWPQLYARIAGGLYCGVFIASVVRTWVCHLSGIFRIRLLHHGIPDRPLEVLPPADRRAAGDRGLGGISSTAFGSFLRPRSKRDQHG